MKNLRFLFLAAVLLSLAGCDSVGMKVRQHFAGPEYRQTTVAAESRQAYEAAVVALKQIGFTYVRGGATQGRLEAMGPVLAPDGRGTARQRMLDAKFAKNLDGGTVVSVLFTELVEEDFNKRPGHGMITPLRETPLYDVFFRGIDAALASKR